MLRNDKQDFEQLNNTQHKQMVFVNNGSPISKAIASRRLAVVL